MTRQVQDGLRLGHITYSNCFPVHARLIDRPSPGDPILVPGIPSELNELLARGEIDAAPCSSIEYARHADRYRILPELVIGSHGAVRSILLVGKRPAPDLDGRAVALPTASATSVVLLKILAAARWAVSPRYFWFDQSRDDPFAGGADAALFIGDVALRSDLHSDAETRLDLGAEWLELTGLPFAFAVWQITAGNGRSAAGELLATLLESRRYGELHRAELAARYAAAFDVPASLLASYWAELRYELDAQMQEGLRAFYRMAVELGEIAAAPSLRWAR